MSKQFSILILLAVVVLAAVLWYFIPSTPKPISTQASSAPATTTTAPTTLPATQPAPMRTLVDVVLESDPHFPSTQPLTIPGDLSDGSRLMINEPVYLDPHKDLWITHPLADPTADVIKRANDEQLHLTRETVRFVHYWTDEKEVNHFALVCENSPGRFEYVTEKKRVSFGLPDAPAFKSAEAWDANIVVPSEHGVYILTPGDSMGISYQKIADDGERTLFARDPQGLLAWSPPKDGNGGSAGAYRFVDGAWTHLDASKNWPAKILHLIPLLDGSVLVLREDSNRAAGVSVLSLGDAKSSATTQPVVVDEAKIAELVGKLSDKESLVREQAFAELARYGPGAFGVFEKLKASQPAGARLRLDELLRSRMEQSLGTLRLEAGPLTAISRFNDGGAVYYGEAGVTIFSENVGPQLFAPAFISVRPGRAVRLLPEFLTRDFSVTSQRLVAYADEWFIADDLQGVRRFIGNHFQSVLKKRERDYNILIGIDRRGRWLFTNKEHAATLILDPTLPNPTPKLPVWEYPVKGGEIGWTKDNYAAVKRSGAWVLMEKEWRPLNEEKEQFLTEVAGADNAFGPPTTSPTSAPATLPTTATTEPTTQPILIETDGTKWFDGADHLIKLAPNGTKTDWELPGIAVGGGKVRLFRVDNRRLLLFNQTARILSLRETPGGKEPFKLDAIFTDKIPDTDAAKRIWQDPSGRVLIAIEDKLWILFPAGKVPEQLENMMPPGSMSEEE